MSAPIAGLVAHWQMEEDGAASRVDAVGGHDFTAVNSPGRVAGKFGYAAGFNGVNQYLRATDSELLLPDASTAELAVAGWATIGDKTSDGVLIARYEQTDNNKAWYVRYDTGNDILTLRQSDNGSGVSESATGVSVASIAEDEWFFFAARFNATHGDLRVNATDMTPLAGDTPIKVDSNAPLVVGGRLTGASLGDDYTGAVDSLSVWNLRPSDADVSWLYNGGAGRAGRWWMAPKWGMYNAGNLSSCRQMHIGGAL